MSGLNSSKTNLKLEDFKNGGNQKVFDAISSGIDIKKLKKLVRSFKFLDLKRANYEYLKSRLIHLQNGYFLSSVTSDTESPLYRGVVWAEKPTHKSQLSYPPASIVKLGRANNPGKPVFYASAGCHSTMMEVAPMQGERIAISKWLIKQNLNLIGIGYTENATTGKSGANRCQELPWVKQYDADPLSKRNGNQFIHEFLAREFTKKVSPEEEWEYKISAAISELTFNAFSFGINGAPAIEISGIVYPSSPNDANADNLALKPSVADSHLEFVSVQYIEVSKKTDLPEYTIIGLDFADSLSPSGDINWMNSFPADRIAGTDHTVKHGIKFIEVIDNKKYCSR